MATIKTSNINELIASLALSLGHDFVDEMREPGLELYTAVDLVDEAAEMMPAKGTSYTDDADKTQVTKWSLTASTASISTTWKSAAFAKGDDIYSELTGSNSIDSLTGHDEHFYASNPAYGLYDLKSGSASKTVTGGNLHPTATADRKITALNASENVTITLAADKSKLQHTWSSSIKTDTAGYIPGASDSVIPGASNSVISSYSWAHKDTWTDANRNGNNSEAFSFAGTATYSMSDSDPTPTVITVKSISYTETESDKFLDERNDSADFSLKANSTVGLKYTFNQGVLAGIEGTLNSLNYSDKVNDTWLDDDGNKQTWSEDESFIASNLNFDLVKEDRPTLAKAMLDYLSTENDDNLATLVEVLLSGNDVLNATGSETNTLYGGAGNDVLNGSKAYDYLSGGVGNDQLKGNAGNDALYGGDADDKLDGGSEADYLYGDSAYSGNDDTAPGGNDILMGGSGNDFLYGGAGHDSLDGGLHNDTLYGGLGKDTLLGGGGRDTLGGGAGDDKLDGGASNDWLEGGADNDSLIGGIGVDMLRGGAGVDTLTGGTQQDLFVFSTGDSGTLINPATPATSTSPAIPAKGQWDVITDFKLADGDMIVIDSINLQSAENGGDSTVNSLIELGTTGRPTSYTALRDIAEDKITIDGNNVYVGITSNTTTDKNLIVADANKGAFVFVDSNNDGNIDMTIQLLGVTTASQINIGSIVDSDYAARIMDNAFNDYYWYS